MKSQPKYSLLMRCKAMAVLAVYLFVTLSFIFFLCRLVPYNSNKPAANSKIESIHYHSNVQREDKATLSNNKYITGQNLSAVVLYLLFTAALVSISVLPFYINYSRIINNHRFSYLTLLSLRI